MIVFGLQQGPAAHWQPWIWALIVAGTGLMSVFDALHFPPLVAMTPS